MRELSFTEARHNVSYVGDLVLGADDSVLREFTELHVVFVRERVPARETKRFEHHGPFIEERFKKKCVCVCVCEGVTSC